MKNKHIGSSFDDFMEEEGLLVESEAIAIKRVIVYQLEEEMKARHLSKAALARSMKTSRSALDRLLDPNNSSVTLKTLDAAAHALGKRVQLSLV